MLTALNFLLAMQMLHTYAGTYNMQASDLKKVVFPCIKKGENVMSIVYEAKETVCPISDCTDC